MSVEQALLEQAPSVIAAAKAERLLRDELTKGCSPLLVAKPVSLEPVYSPMRRIGGRAGQQVESIPIPDSRRAYRRIWMSPLQSWDWNRCELFLKQLSVAQGAIGFDLIGDRHDVSAVLHCDAKDMPILEAAFRGTFESCHLSPMNASPLSGLSESQWRTARFRDYYPLPPYTHLFTQPDELNLAPCVSVLTNLMQIEPPAIGLYQVLFQPVRNNWHANVEEMLDLEFRVKLMANSIQRYSQQMPSGDLRHMAVESQIKAHNDKPFFVAAMRVAMFCGGDAAGPLLDTLTAFTGMIQHGGRPLQYVDHHDYAATLDGPCVPAIFMQGMTYRNGFLVNSNELATFVHPPPPPEPNVCSEVMPPLETLVGHPSLEHGTQLGYCAVADQKTPICIPASLRNQHTHLIGSTGTGKSTLLVHMILHDILAGEGVAVLDPHGSLVQQLLRLIPPEHADRVIHFDPGHPKWIPHWNPIAESNDRLRSRVADDLVRAFHSIVSGWGDRLEHLLRQAVLAVLYLPDGCLLDVANLLRVKSPEHRALSQRVLQAIPQGQLRSFWENDISNYGKADLAPPQHKLSKLLSAGPISLMLSQPASAFRFSEMMSHGSIFLADLSTVGTDIRKILGCFILSLLHVAALGRGTSSTTESRGFRIHCDEAHRFVTDTIEDLIAETRKFNVGLTLAHQYLSQFESSQIDAISGVGTTIVFKVDRKDATYLKKDFQNKVNENDLITLDSYQAIARIGKHIARIQTLPPPKPYPEEHAQKIIAESQRRYCQDAEVIRANLYRGGDATSAPLVIDTGEGFEYDEF